MKNYYFIFIIFFTIYSISSAADNQFYPDSLACPVEELVIPNEIIAAHSTNILKEIVTGKHGRKWKAQKDKGTIRFKFKKNTIIRRFQINLIGINTDKPIPIEFAWTPQDSMWGVRTGNFMVTPNGKSYCFFLGYHVKIPENVAAYEIAFKFPAGLFVHSLSFSENPSEVVMEACPMPKLGEEIKNAYDECIQNPGDIEKERKFVILFEKSLHKYDCRRSFDYKPVPAWWLCEYKYVDKWLRLLSQLKSTEAKKLFGSNLFRSTLDGGYAEEYYEDSLLTEREFK